MFIAITQVDVITKIVCTQEPMRTGPEFPQIKGFIFQFDNSSIWPISTTENGVYINAPLLYGICDDDADITVAGVVSTYTAEEFESLKMSEYQARKPFPSWIGDINTMSWEPPTPYPVDGNNYYWDESSITWIKRTVVEYI
jgi:hypothetical protein